MQNHLASLPKVQQLRILPYSCVCQALNHFGKDIYKLCIIPKVLAQVKVVCQVFRKVLQAKYALQTEKKAAIFENSSVAHVDGHSLELECRHAS